MKTIVVLGLMGAAAALSACSSETDARKAHESIAEVSNAVSAANPRYLRVQVSYEAAQFKVERVTWVDGKLKQPRSGKARPGLQYVALAPGSSFVGNAPDPRTVHVEVPDANGKLQDHEAIAPGKQNFLIYVPAETETVNFLNAVKTPTGARNTSAAAAGVLSSIDLRSFK